MTTTEPPNAPPRSVCEPGHQLQSRHCLPDSPTVRMSDSTLTTCGAPGHPLISAARFVAVLPSAMAEINVNAQEVSVVLTTGEKAGGVKGDFSIPVSAITAVIRSADPITKIRGIRAPGAGFPNRRIGTWRSADGVKDYVSVTRGEPGLIFMLEGQHFSRVLLSLPDPVAAAAELEAVGVVVTDPPSDETSVIDNDGR